MIEFVKKHYTREKTLTILVKSFLGTAISFILAILTLISNGGQLTLLTALPLFGLPLVVLTFVLLYYYPLILKYWNMVRTHISTEWKKLLTVVRTHFKKDK